jgi:co-chaperonin GroES (HSP10)
MSQSNENQKNASGLQPLGRAVLVKPYEPEKKNSLIVMPDAVNERLQMLDTRATVVAIGPACWPDEPPRAKVGDKVLISRMAGTIVKGTADGVMYRAINDRDIFMEIVEEVSNA